MKNLIPKLICMMSLASCFSSKAQTPNNHGNSPDDSSRVSSHQLVCKLTGPEFRKRLDDLRDHVFTKAESYQETAKGYIFQFKNNDDFLRILLDYILSERHCCPFFDFELSIKANEANAMLLISGPEGAKEMIEMMIGG